MSIFNELLPKLNEISNKFIKNFSDDLKAAFESLDKFEADLNAKSKAREQSHKDKNQTSGAIMVLQSINEEEDATSKTPEGNRQSDKSSDCMKTDSSDRISKKRSKHEVDGMESPEVEKRPKRNASVRAQGIISEQVNLNLTKKIRRETSIQKQRRRKDEDKENDPEPIAIVKQEKISLPPEPVDLETIPMNVDIKQEVKEVIVMPPPPVPKPRKKADKTDEVSDADTTRRRTTRNRKQTDTQPDPAPARESRTRRGRTKVQETSTIECDKETMASENEIASPAQKPRPKRTKRGQKASEKKEVEKEIEKPDPENLGDSPKEYPSERRNTQSLVLQKIKPKTTKHKVNETQNTDQIVEIKHPDETDADSVDNMDKTKIISQLNCTRTIIKEIDTTIVSPTGECDQTPETPKNVPQMNETVVLDKAAPIETTHPTIMNATVVIGECKPENMSSLMTDDDEPLASTPPQTHRQENEPTSAVKEKVQQFEEMASRVTRTKTRAMTKKEPSDSRTPPDRSQPVIAQDTLSKMNDMIFNGKTQISSSASKPRTNVPVKSFLPSSTSKLSANGPQEEERKEKEDARKKKEALLEAKREQQRSKREQKMSAAALARSAAESSRRAAMQAAAKERKERQAQIDHGRAERMKEAERKRQEQARKAAETEERRKQEEAARAQKRADEQRKADAARKRQLEEASAVKKEAAIMQKEIERKQREFMERMKMKQRMEGDRMTPHKTLCTPSVPMEPVYMQDGFQYLNSDDEEPSERLAPVWSTSKVRRVQLLRQSKVSSQHVYRLFSVREHTPDLREIFPNIDRARLKRTSSAVWRTPPRLPPLHE